MTTKEKTIDVLETVLVTHEIVQKLHGDLPALKKTDAKIRKLIEELKR